jgi:hypothetical protein
MKETNEQRIARIEIKDALEALLQACQNNKAGFCGFVWGTDPPIIIRFGNVNETGPDFTALLLKLEDLVNERLDRGVVINDPLQTRE